MFDSVINRNNSSEDVNDISLKSEKEYSNFQPLRQFVILCLFSFGIYLFFWFYKQWLFLRDVKKMDISLWLRVLLTIFYVIPLFSIFYSLAKEKGYTKRPFYELYVVFYVVALLYSRIDFNGLTILISLFAFVFIIPMHKMINFYYLKNDERKEIRKKINLDEKLFLGFIWALLLFVMFFNNNV